MRAKRSNPYFLCGEMDCFVACAPRKDDYDTDPSCPDLIRASIHLRKKVVSKKMDHRVKPGDDDFTAPAEREPHPFALYSRASEPKLRAKATSQ